MGARRALIVPVVALALGLAGCGGDPEAGGADRSEDERAEVTTLTVDGRPSQARCVAPNVDTLRAQDVAFAGTVVGMTDHEVTLAVEEWYAGEETDTVLVEAPPEVFEELLGAVRFAEGGDYLVSASDGAVTLCGMTAERSEELERLYDEAF